MAREIENSEEEKAQWKRERRTKVRGGESSMGKRKGRDTEEEKAQWEREKDEIHRRRKLNGKEKRTRYTGGESSMGKRKGRDTQEEKAQWEREKDEIHRTGKRSGREKRTRFIGGESAMAECRGRNSQEESQMERRERRDGQEKAQRNTYDLQEVAGAWAGGAAGGAAVAGKRPTWSDNMALVQAINCQSGNCSVLVGLLRELVRVCLLRNVEFRTRHVQGVKNVAADALSRFQWAKFRTACPQAMEEMTPFKAVWWRLVQWSKGEWHWESYHWPRIPEPDTGRVSTGLRH
ncbi:hypothetical protein NDU88_001503 [Pleurodeles waltl]|uniref:Uncharacterized protein n=1 Tax=Pleurodeles waltl TaxID=8319 RepID=A0AAV7U772_PLEWA|nr:hypothetical protein NDU88_001503 [Pleurodeles waltl]